MLSIIAAMSKNRVIGRNNEIPWHIPADLKHFASITRGNIVIMGRKTFESIIKRLGKPLPERENIVLTTQKDFEYLGVTVAHSLEEALHMTTGKTAFVIGGEKIYSIALPIAKKMYITEIDTNCEGDAYFPEFNKNEWKTVLTVPNKKDKANKFDYTFLTYERI